MHCLNDECYVNCDILAKEILLNRETIRTALCSYKFSKFRIAKRFNSKILREAYILNRDFAKEFIKYLKLRDKEKEIKLFIDFCKRTFGGKQ